MTAVPSFLRAAGAGVELDVLVQPRASRTRVVGPHGGRLKLQLAAPPVDGEANLALVECVADLFGRARRDVHLLHGATGRRKTLRIDGLGLEDAAARVEAAR